MIEKLNNHLENLGLQKTLYLTAFIGLASDILLVLYLSKSMLPKMFTTEYLAKVFAFQGVDINQLNPLYVEEVKSFMLSSANTMFLGILVYNFIIYVLYTKRKKFAITYIKGYVLTGAVFSIFEFLAPLFSAYKPNIVTAITFLTYLFIFFSIRYFKKELAR